MPIKTTINPYFIRAGLKVQGHVADDLIDGDTYEAVPCTACGRVHLVNPKSGKVLEPAKK
jgi:hypothetical protein